MLYGYARVSTTDQDVAIQRAALQAAGCSVIRSEKISGTSRQGREELATLLEFIREGDTLVITRLDRLARSVPDLYQIVQQIEGKGAHLKVIEQPINTSDAAGRAFLGMLAVFAEFETNLRAERQREGIAKAKAEGVYKGRPSCAKKDEIIALARENVGPSEIARRLNVGRSTVYRTLIEAEGATT